ncbi:MAG: glutamate formimidoyltransferase [Actinomycetota bacterium]|nr:glutamate formimidoyltransferase [Actinomycetota bacterium]
MLEAVPNVSEGRDAAAIEEIGHAFASRAMLLDVHADVDHHRSVFTLAADANPLVESLVAGIARALELVDLRLHDGVHPRVGAVDVVPLVPLVSSSMALAEKAALIVAQRVGGELELPVFLYGTVGGGKRPAFFRSGGLAELERRVVAGELRVDAGPSRLDPRSGAILVGARPPLVAYNVVLGADDAGVARAIAASIRESGGGMPGVQAIGLELPGSGRIQVSMNVVDLERAPLHEVVERVRQEATSHGVEVVDGELVGLVPERVLADAAAAGVSIPGVDESRVLERVLGPSAF